MSWDLSPVVEAPSYFYQRAVAISLGALLLGAVYYMVRRGISVEDRQAEEGREWGRRRWGKD